MFCVNCGNQIESYFKYCPYCATNISTGMQPNSNNSDFEVVAGTLVKYKGSSTEIVIPNNVVQIGKEAFYNMIALKSVIIPGNVKTINYGAFDSCISLSSVTFSEGVNHIGRRAFAHCKSLKSIILPDSITIIDECAFAACSSLVEIKLPSKLPYLSPRTFEACVELEKIKIPDSVLEMRLSYKTGDDLVSYKDIKTSCFIGCKKLINIIYPTHFTAEDFYGTPVYEEWHKKYIEQVAKNICPRCGQKLSLFGNKCKHCNIRY